MAREFSRSFYTGKQWKSCRRSFISMRISIDGGMCQRCHNEIGYIVDHIIELTESNISDPEISLNHENLSFLCLPCHNKKTFGTSEVIRDDLMFDSNGDVVEKIT